MLNIRNVQRRLFVDDNENEAAAILSSNSFLPGSYTNRVNLNINSDMLFNIREESESSDEITVHLQIETDTSNDEMTDSDNSDEDGQNTNSDFINASTNGYNILNTEFLSAFPQYGFPSLNMPDLDLNQYIAESAEHTDSFFNSAARPMPDPNTNIPFWSLSDDEDQTMSRHPFRYMEDTDDIDPLDQFIPIHGQTNFVDRLAVESQWINGATLITPNFSVFNTMESIGVAGETENLDS